MPLAVVVVVRAIPWQLDKGGSLMNLSRDILKQQKTGWWRRREAGVVELPKKWGGKAAYLLLYHLKVRGQICLLLQFFWKVCGGGTQMPPLPAYQVPPPLRRELDGISWHFTRFFFWVVCEPCTIPCTITSITLLLHVSKSLLPYIYCLRNEISFP